MVRLSFVVPCLNSAATIAATLDGILRTQLPTKDFEVIVVDNGSTDRTVEIARAYPVRILECPVRGAGPARNYGAREASGKFLAFIDSDTVVNEDWAPILLDLAEKNFYSAVLGRVIPAGPDTFLTRYRKALSRRRYRGTNISLLDPVGISATINTAACLYRRKIFLALGGFDERLERCEDTDLSNRLFLAGGVIGASSKAIAYVSNAGKPKDYLKRSIRLGISKMDIYSINSTPWRRAVHDTITEFWAPDLGVFTFAERLFYYLNVTLLLLGLFRSVIKPKLPPGKYPRFLAEKLLLLFRLQEGNREFSLSPGTRLISLDEEIYLFSMATAKWQNFSKSRIPWTQLEEEKIILSADSLRNEVING